MGKVIASLQGADIGEEASDNDAWSRFVAELDEWAHADKVAEFWWRDDDATLPGPRLDRLLSLAGDHPLSLAVIPTDAKPSLAALLRTHNAGGGRIAVFQHGFSHRNHAPKGEKKAEFGEHRAIQPMLDEIAEGCRRMTEIFNGQFKPAFTPPWNRICGAVADRLGEAGLKGLSRFGPRRQDEGGSVVNAHIDIVDWRGGRGFVGADAALDKAIAHLAAKRQGGADPGEPTGLLTHHRDHDEACWHFIAALLDAVDRHEAATWVTGAPAGAR